MRDELLTLGRSARPWRLSVEQLRLHDETGLPAPARWTPAPAAATTRRSRRATP
ncbi:hypothetical protein ACYTFC_00520 [Streptomyces globosus]|uniref:hypothetical protein n=1 Tax=Streptomyces sp. WAC05292 TaxID=2487418 RepID=UPI0021AEEEBE|nr:hypothetical protein [Streptomyces sp. WAC05292]